MKKLLSEKLLLLFIIILASLLRLWDLGNMPYGIADDEARIIYSAYSIWHTGRDVSGAFLPLSININASFSPVYIYATAPFVGLLGVSPFTGRLPFALLAIGAVWLTYLIAKKISGNSFVACASAFVMAVSPWHLQASRSALDHNFALFFYLLGIYIFIKTVGKNSILWSLPAFIIAFYSYHATKIFFVFLVPVLLIYYLKELRKYKIQTILFVVCSFLLFFSFLAVVKTQSVTRQEVLIGGDQTDASKIVNYERRYNEAPDFLRQVFNNKPLYFLRIFRQNYLQAFSPEFLFLYGDSGSNMQMVSLYTRGAFYIADVIFLLLGLYYVLRFEKNKLLLFLVLIAPLPSAFATDQTYFSRSIMLLPFLEILIGYGIYYLYTICKAKNKHILYGTMSLLAVWYFFLILSQVYQYFYRYSLTGAEAWNASSRELATYISQNKNNFQQVTVDGAPQAFLIQYAVFNKIDPYIIQKDWSHFYGSQIDNVLFINICQPGNIHMPLPDHPQSTLYISYHDCYYSATTSAVITDKGESIRNIWKIY